MVYSKQCNDMKNTKFTKLFLGGGGSQEDIYTVYIYIYIYIYIFGLSTLMHAINSKPLTR